MFSVRHELLKDILGLNYHVSCCSSVAVAILFTVSNSLVEHDQYFLFRVNERTIYRRCPYLGNGKSV